MISIKDSDGVITEHIPDRLEVSLIEANGDIEKLELKIYFQVKTILPNGKIVGEPYLDIVKPLWINCKGNIELTQAMMIIQEAIGTERYKQMTVPPVTETS